MVDLTAFTSTDINFAYGLPIALAIIFLIPFFAGLASSIIRTWILRD